MPEDYSRWLISHEDHYHKNIGEHLLGNSNKVLLDRKKIKEDLVIKSIKKCIEDKLNSTKFDLVVFSNPFVKLDCDIMKSIDVERNCHFILRRELYSWAELITSNYHILENKLKYESFYIQYKSEIEKEIELSFAKLSMVLYDNLIIPISGVLFLRKDLRKMLNESHFGMEYEKITYDLMIHLTSIVEKYRESNEYQTCNNNEKEICELLGLDYYPLSREDFCSFSLSYGYYEIENNIISIIKSAWNITDSIEYFTIDHWKEDAVIRHLQSYFRFHWLEKLRKAFDELILDHEPNAKKTPKFLCFLSTAMCKHFNKDDDCFELTILRGYRDFWLKFEPDGETIIQNYYSIAPIILSKIDCDLQRNLIYDYIKQTITSCVELIVNNEFMKVEKTEHAVTGARMNQ